MVRKKTLIHLQFSEKSTVGLRGRQSVRTTFKLSERSISALAILAGQLGIKQKSLFDHLIEDTKALKTIASEFEEFAKGGRRIAKTYVISRKTLENLETVSSQYNTPRDALVEYSIDRILPLLNREKEKHKKRKELKKNLQIYLQAGVELLEATEKDLGEDDPTFQQILAMVRAVDTCCGQVSELVKKGTRVEEF